MPPLYQVAYVWDKGAWMHDAVALFLTVVGFVILLLSSVFRVHFVSVLARVFIGTCGMVGIGKWIGVWMVDYRSLKTFWAGQAYHYFQELAPLPQPTSY